MRLGVGAEKNVKRANFEQRRNAGMASRETYLPRCIIQWAGPALLILKQYEGNDGCVT